MPNCYFVSDIHGKTGHYDKLFSLIIEERPDALFLGGDLLPHHCSGKNFINDYLIPELSSIKHQLKAAYPEIFLILGNDDARSEENLIIAAAEKDFFHYVHLNSSRFAGHTVVGYSYTPPSPCLLKDWEKYDVSRYTEHGCISPEEGKRTIEISDDEKKYSTMKKDLELLGEGEDVQNTIILFHGPPYQTNLDRAALDNKIIDHAPVDVNVGSIAIRKFIEKNQPFITMHGHIHESARITGSWRDRIGKTYCFSAAHEGPELAVVKINLGNPDGAERILL